MNISKLINNLEKNGFKASYFETGNEAIEYIDSIIENATVGIGGSVTVDELGLYDKLKSHNTVYWHWKNYDGELTRDEIYKGAQTADVYISSVNGIAETGEIINIDGTGNRVSAIQYGHKKVILVLGINKIAEDYDSALYRARNIAAPMNAKRLNRKTPCAEKGDKCYNCQSNERICRGLSVLWKKPGCCEYEIVVIGEKLGY